MVAGLSAAATSTSRRDSVRSPSGPRREGCTDDAEEHLLRRRRREPSIGRRQNELLDAGAHEGRTASGKDGAQRLTILLIDAVRGLGPCRSGAGQECAYEQERTGEEQERAGEEGAEPQAFPSSERSGSLIRSPGGDDAPPGTGRRRRWTTPSRQSRQCQAVTRAAGLQPGPGRRYSPWGSLARVRQLSEHPPVSTLLSPTPVDMGPVVVGATGGSGTRVVARILRDQGLFIGSELNESEDAWKLGDYSDRWINLYLSHHGDPLPLEVRSAMAQDLRLVLEEHCACLAEGRPWGWKEPRSIYLLPFFHAQLPAAPIPARRPRRP